MVNRKETVRRRHALNQEYSVSYHSLHYWRIRRSAKFTSLVQKFVTSTHMADHAVSAPISSEIPLWEKWAELWAEQDTELRVVAQRIWHVTHRSKMAAAYIRDLNMVTFKNTGCPHTNNFAQSSMKTQRPSRCHRTAISTCCLASYSTPF